MDQTFYTKNLERLDAGSLKRCMRTVDGAQDRKIIVDGKKVLNFCSNNYLGLANDPRLAQAATKSFRTDGFGSGASRLVCGNMRAHQELEEVLANFKGTDACLTFSTGYMANVGIISALFSRDDLIFSDKLNHASIVDGIVLSRARHIRYPHCDMHALKKMLHKYNDQKGKKAIITDSVFSMDGDIAPLKQITELAKEFNCYVMIDEAHAFGVLGENGRGAAEYLGVEDKVDIQMGTFSKAAGSFGAYCCARGELISFLVNKARSAIYTTGIPPGVAAASKKAVEIIQSEPNHRYEVLKKASYVREKLKGMGFDTLNSQTPIIPIVIGDNQKAVEFSQRMFEKGFYISAIRPPTVPVGTARLRLTVTAAHTQNDLDQLLNNIHEIGETLCLL